MRRQIAALLLVVLAGGACATGPVSKRLEWQGHVLREVRSVTQIPAVLQSSLGVGRPGLEGVAERGQPFNSTDMVDERLPMRRFFVAGRDSDTWLVALEHGGRGYRVEVFLFEGPGSAPKQKWVLLNRPKTLGEVIRSIRLGGPHEGQPSTGADRLRRPADARSSCRHDAQPLISKLTKPVSQSR